MAKRALQQEKDPSKEAGTVHERRELKSNPRVQLVFRLQEWAKFPFGCQASLLRFLNKTAEALELSDDELVPIADLMLPPTTKPDTISIDFVHEVRAHLSQMLALFSKYQKRYEKTPISSVTVDSYIDNAIGSLAEWKGRLRVDVPAHATRAKDDVALFGVSLHRMRLDKGLTQTQLSEVSGITQSHVSAIERGAWEPRLKTIMALARALNVQPGDLLPSIVLEASTSLHAVHRGVDQEASTNISGGPPRRPKEEEFGPGNPPGTRQGERAADDRQGGEQRLADISDLLSSNS